MSKPRTVVPEVFLSGAYAYAYTGYFGPDIQSFAGYINFHGDGNLDGEGTVNKLGTTVKAISFTGTYRVYLTWTPFVATGTFQTKDKAGIVIDYYFVMADNWKELKFMMKDAAAAKTMTQTNPVVSGTMRRISS